MEKGDKRLGRVDLPMLSLFPSVYFGGKGTKGVVPDVREKIRNMPRWSWKPEQELGLFYFAIEHHQRFSMAGWIPTPVLAGNGCAVFVDMLAGSGERGEFVEAPVKEVVPSPILPPGWRRVENVFGRIHYEHSASGLGMYRHPSGSARVNQSTGYPIISFTADHGDRNGRRGRWILDESTRVPPQYITTDRKREGPRYHKWVLDDPKAPCQLSTQVFPRWPEYSRSDWMKHLANNGIVYSVQEPEHSQDWVATRGDGESCSWPNLGACCDITREYHDIWVKGGFNHAVPRRNNTRDDFLDSTEGETWPSPPEFEFSLLSPTFPTTIVNNSGPSVDQILSILSLLLPTTVVDNSGPSVNNSGPSVNNSGPSVDQVLAFIRRAGASSIRNFFVYE